MLPVTSGLWLWRICYGLARIYVSRFYCYHVIIVNYFFISCLGFWINFVWVLDDLPWLFWYCLQFLCVLPVMFLLFYFSTVELHLCCFWDKFPSFLAFIKNRDTIANSTAVRFPKYHFDTDATFYSGLFAFNNKFTFWMHFWLFSRNWIMSLTLLSLD